MIRPNLRNLSPLTAVVLLTLAGSGTTAAMAQTKPAMAQTTPAVQILDNNISLAQVLKAQEGWCTALLQISADYAKGGITKANATAIKVILITHKPPQP